MYQGAGLERSDKTINFISDTSLLFQILQKICITFVIQMIRIFKNRIRTGNSKQIKLTITGRQNGPGLLVWGLKALNPRRCTITRRHPSYAWGWVEGEPLNRADIFLEKQSWLLSNISGRTEWDPKGTGYSKGVRGQLSGLDTVLSLLRAQVQSLVEEIRSCKLLPGQK